MSSNRTNDAVIDDDIKAKFLIAEEACAGGGCTLPTTMELKIRVCNFCKKIILFFLSLACIKVENIYRVSRIEMFLLN